MPNQYVNKVLFGNTTVMDITDTTAEAADVIDGEVFYTSSGARSVGTLSDATQSAHGLMSATDKTKLDGLTSMVVLSYGISTWQDFITAYSNNAVVYCRASSNSDPASGSQTRMAFMAYVNNATNPNNVEFQYYRSMSSHSATAMGDEVYIYKLTDSNGGTWSVTTRKASIKEIAVASGSKLDVSWSSDKVTLSNTMTADDMPMSSSDSTTTKAAIEAKYSKPSGGIPATDLADTYLTAHQDISGKVSGPSSASDAHVALFDGTTGKLIKDSGFTIGTSVPANAVFTDTTYDVMTGATSSAVGTSGLVPAPTSDDRTKFLRGSGTWEDAIIPSSLAYYESTDTATHNISSNEFIYWKTLGVAQQDISIGDTLNIQTVMPILPSGALNMLNAKINNPSPFTGATSATDGTKGCVPAPLSGDENKFLRGDGSWQTVPSGGVSSITINGSTLVPTSGNINLGSYVTLSTDQTISGIKTFTASPIIATDSSEYKEILFRQSESSTSSAGWISYYTGSTTNYTEGYFIFGQRVPNSTPDINGVTYRELYVLPTTSNTVSDNATYNIWTTKTLNIDTSITAASTSTNIPTSQAVAAFVEGKGYLTTHQDISGKANVSGQIFTGNIGVNGTLNKSNQVIVQLDTQAMVALLVGSGNENHGVYSYGYRDNTTSVFTSSTKWIVHRDKTGAVKLDGHGITDNSSSTAVTSSDTNLITARTLYYAGYTKNTGTITKVQANGTDVASSGTANIPAASTSVYGVTKLGTTSTTAAAGNHSHTNYASCSSSTYNTNILTQDGGEYMPSVVQYTTCAANTTISLGKLRNGAIIVVTRSGKTPDVCMKVSESTIYATANNSFTLTSSSHTVSFTNGTNKLYITVIS